MKSHRRLGFSLVVAATLFGAASFPVHAALKPREGGASGRDLPRAQRPDGSRLCAEWGTRARSGRRRNRGPPRLLDDTALRAGVFKSGVARV